MHRSEKSDILNPESISNFLGKGENGITDFINMMGTNPLIGPNDERFGPRFPDMTEPYSLALRNLAKQTADELGIAYKEGVYMGFMGP